MPRIIMKKPISPILRLIDELVFFNIEKSIIKIPTKINPDILTESINLEFLRKEKPFENRLILNSLTVKNNSNNVHINKIKGLWRGKSIKGRVAKIIVMNKDIKYITKDKESDIKETVIAYSKENLVRIEMTVDIKINIIKIIKKEGINFIKKEYKRPTKMLAKKIIIILDFEKLL